MSSEKDKMLRGEPYDPQDPQLTAERLQARLLLKQYNETSPDQLAERLRLIKTLMPAAGAEVWLEPPFYCDYGSNITLGDRAYFNFNCVVLDVMPVVIGSGVLCGPAVQIYTATHPFNAAERRAGLELARPVTIGNDVWVGGGAIICPGVKIGDRAVIGAGSVVTKNIPEGVLAVGNPCRVLRKLDE
jgi:maltose O-acetyltransferase